MTRPPVMTIADELFFTTVFIEAYSPVGASTGTGFIVLYPVGSGSIPVLVTNKHVFGDATSVAFTLTRAIDGVPDSGGTRMIVEDFGQNIWLGHPSPDVDIAVMFFASVLTAMEANGAPAFYRGFTQDLLVTQDNVEKLDAIEAVTFLGYPNGLFDRVSMSPIARRGQTATPIFNDYNGLPAFLIDASVFPGSSGSPVVLYDRGSYSTRDGVTHIGTRVALLGVVAAVHTRRVNGTVELVRHGVAMFDDMIDLGIVFKSSAIQECAVALFARAGVPLDSQVPLAADLA